MNIKYCNENLVRDTEINNRFILDKDLLSDAAYFVQRKCNSIDFNSKIEERRSEEFSKYRYDSIANLIYIFKENFAKVATGGNIYKVNFEDEHQIGALNYLKRTYPYCFFLNGYVPTKDLDSALLFYAKNNLGASDDELNQIIPLLKSISLDIVDPKIEYSCNFNYDYILFDKINGSTVEKYAKTNLYDALVTLDDKNLLGFINYIVVRDALMNPENIFKNERACVFESDGKYYVEEGNHRLFTCRALYEIIKCVNKGIEDTSIVKVNVRTLKK